MAIGECCRVRKPNVYIYELESKRLYRILRLGTALGINFLSCGCSVHSD